MAYNGLGGGEQGQIRDSLKDWDKRVTHVHPKRPQDRKESGPPLPLSGMILLVGLVSCLIVPLQRGAIYARYSTNEQHSIEDQIRVCQEWAQDNDVEILNEHIFCDKGKSGRSKNRPGYQAMIQALASDNIQTLVVFNTSRLGRLAHEVGRFLEQEITRHGKRCVFIKSGIDTNDGHQCKLLYQFSAIMDEYQLTIGAEHVRAALEGLFLQGRVFGSTPTGYRGEDIPGVVTRKGRPARRLAIEPEMAEWVRTIYRWYLDDRMTVTQIAQKLSELSVPPPPCSRAGCWMVLAVQTY